MDLLDISSGKKDAQIIYDYMMKSIEDWGLDMQKRFGFGSNGAITMLGQISGLATGL